MPSLGSERDTDARAPTPRLAASGGAAAASTFHSVLVLTAGRLVGVAVGFIIPVVLIRIFDQAEFGTYKQLFLIAATLWGVAQLGMAESLYYFLPQHPRAAGRYGANSLVALGVGGLGCLALLVAGGAPISRWLSNSELAGHSGALGLYLLLLLPSAMLEVVLVARKRHGLAAGSYAGLDILKAVLFVVPVVLVPKLDVLLVGAVAFAALRFGLTLGYLRWEFGRTLRPSRQLLISQLGYTVPFYCAGLVEIFQANLHQYVVSYSFDAATFAIYSVGCLQIPLVDSLYASAGNVMMVRMAEEIRDGRTAVAVAVWHDTIRRLALALFPLVGALLVCAHALIVVLYTERYRASVPIFMVATLGILLSTIAVDCVLRVWAQTRFIFALTVVRLVVTAGLIQWFLTTFHLVGPILVTVFASGVSKSLGLMRMQRLMKVGIAEVLPWRSLAWILGAAAGAGVPALLVTSGLDLSPLVRLVVSGVVYVGAYVALLLRLGLLHEHERVALTEWLRRWPRALPG
jgi:O-antigen/teichoic acid export membrane protein